MLPPPSGYLLDIWTDTWTYPNSNQLLSNIVLPSQYQISFDLKFTTSVNFGNTPFYSVFGIFDSSAYRYPALYITHWNSKHYFYLNAWLSGGWWTIALIYLPPESLRDTNDHFLVDTVYSIDIIYTGDFVFKVNGITLQPIATNGQFYCPFL